MSVLPLILAVVVEGLALAALITNSLALAIAGAVLVIVFAIELGWELT